MFLSKHHIVFTGNACFVCRFHDGFAHAFGDFVVKDACSLNSSSVTTEAIAWAAASFISSLISMARQSNAPRKMPGKHRKVFRRTHRLNAVIRIVRNFFFAEQILFDSYCFCLQHLCIPTFFMFFCHVVCDWRFHHVFNFHQIARFS